METTDQIPTEKRKRGRPSGTANTTCIEDKLIEPFKINYDEVQFTLVKKKDNDQEENCGYFSSLEGVLQKIAKSKLNNNTQYSLQGFINEYKKHLKEFTDNINFKA